MHITRVAFLAAQDDIIIRDTLDHAQIADRLHSQGYWTTLRVDSVGGAETPVTLMLGAVASLSPESDEASPT